MPDFETDGDESDDEDFCPEKERSEAESGDLATSDEDLESEDEQDSENDVKSKKKGNRNRSNRRIKEDGQNSRKGRRRQSEDSPEKSDKEDKDEDDPARTNNLWADFLKDVKPTAVVSSAGVPKEKIVTKKESDKKDISKNEKLQSTDNFRESSSTENSREKLDLNKVSKKEESKTEIVDFAGEILVVEKQANGSTIAKTTSLAPVTSLKRPVSQLVGGSESKSNGAGAGGLNSILNQLGKKKKLSVLDKTKMDWTSFKKDEGIDEEIQSFNKGKDG